MLKLYRIRFLREKPYSQKEAEAAVGLTTDNGPKKELAVEGSEEQAATMEVDEVSLQDDYLAEVQ